MGILRVLKSHALRWEILNVISYTGFNFQSCFVIDIQFSLRRLVRISMKQLLTVYYVFTMVSIDLNNFNFYFCKKWKCINFNFSLIFTALSHHRLNLNYKNVLVQIFVNKIDRNITDYKGTVSPLICTDDDRILYIIIHLIANEKLSLWPAMHREFFLFYTFYIKRTPDVFPSLNL
jgi:hypothetical protein